MNGQNITGDQLNALAKKIITPKQFQQAVSEPVFADFVRICILMSQMQIGANEPSTFGHTFHLFDPKTKEKFAVNFDVKVTAAKAP